MADRVCAAADCDEPPRSENALYCSPACSRRASRARSRSDVKPSERDSPPNGWSRTADVKLIGATETALALAGQLDSVLGQIAMTLARDLAHARYGAGAHASLAKELRLVMAEIAPAKPKLEGTQLDGIRGKGAQRRTNPAGLHIVS